MTNKTLPTLLVAILMVLFGACTNEDDLLVNQPEQARTLTLTATMPHDGPTTRVGLEKQDDNSIALTWQDGDELQLLFVQNDIKEKVTASIKNITEEGKKAQFDIVLPSEITEGNFTLYGIYGGGGLDDANPAIVILPANPGNATSLADNDNNSIEKRKDVILYFQSANIDAANPTAAVSFQHLGSLLNITLKNNASTPLNNIKEVRLVGVGGDGKWAYNNNEGAQTYNLLTGEFENKGTAGNYFSFTTTNNTLAANGELTFWGWYPPLPNKNWPELKLELWDETTVISTTTNSKPARSSAIAAGRAFYFYAIWDGSKVSFTDSSYTPEYFIEEGGLEAALGEDKDNIDAMALKGTINSADFEVMKSMSALKHLDLSAVTVAGNKIPDYAFGAAPSSGFGAKNSPPTANTTIETVVLPDNIIAIGKYAFAGCTKLKGDVIIPNSVTTIGDGAFEGCIKLEGTLTLSESLETIGATAFKLCSFNSKLILPSNLVSIGEEAFSWCGNLYGDLIIPNKVTWIGKGAFDQCSQMGGTLTLPPGITSIEDFTFSLCSFTGSLIIPEGVTSIGEAAFHMNNNFNGTISLPQSLETIGTHAFYRSGDFEGNLVIPDKVTVIEDNTFAYTTFSGTLTLSKNLTTIGKEAFQLSSKFVGTLEIPEGVTLIDDYAFHATSSSSSEPGPWSKNRTNKKAFQNITPSENSSGFNRLILPESLITIGSYAFFDCSGFEGNLYLSNNITSIGVNAFDNCAGFTGNLKLPTQLEVISSSAFARCSGFNGTLTLPTALTTIEGWAFAGCENLTGTLSFPATLTTIEYYAFEGCSNFTGELIIPTTLDEVSSGAFAGCEGFTKLTLHDGITEIGPNAFMDCTGLEGQLKLPSNLTYIGYEAFKGCISFTGDLAIPQTVTTIESGAFEACTGFTGNLAIPQTVTTIERRVFEGCTGFTKLTLHEGITEIRANAFMNCIGLEGKLKLPSNLTSIGEYAFHQCSGINNVVEFPITLKSIGEEAFNGCVAVKAFQFPHLIPENPLKYTTNMIPYDATIQVPMEAYQNYKEHEKWNHHKILRYTTGEAGLP